MKRKQRNFWTRWENIVTSLDPIINDLGRFPTQKELHQLGLSSVATALRYYGGHEMVARQLGVPTTSEYHRTPLHDWDSFCNEVAPLVASRGYFPTISELTREGRYDIIAAVRRYHGGAAEVTQRLGVPTYTAFHGHKPARYWTNDRIITAYRDVIRMHSLTFWPSPDDLSEMGYGALRGALQKIGHRKVRELLAEEGIVLSPKPRTLGHLIPFNQQYHMSDEIFAKEELFYYFLGLVAADGSFVSTRNEASVELCLKQGDKELLEKLRDRISPGRPIHIKPHRKNPSHTAVRLKFNDRRLMAMLKEHITTHDKSHTLTWPEHIPDEHLRHFLRGYIDGDGTIGIALNRQTIKKGEVRYYPVIRLRVLGTEAFLTGLTNAIHHAQDIKPVKVHKKGHEQVYEIQYSGRHAKKVLDWLYNDATIFLARKRAVYEYLRAADRITLLSNYCTPAGRYNYLAGKGELGTHEETA